MNDETVYNRANVNDEWNGEVAGQTISGQVVEKIDTNNLQYVTVRGCKHSRVLRQPADDIPGMIEITCQDCPLGWFESQA